MKDKTITRSISQGVYVLTVKNGGCIVDAVSQISSGDNPLISVAVSKNNYTNELLKKNDLFALSVLGKNIDGNIIKTFGLNSMRNINKFAELEFLDVEGIKVIPKSLGYLVCEIVDQIDNDTHTLFIGKLILANRLVNDEILTYQYYQEHKDEYIKVTSEKGKIAWVCTICGYVYYGDELPEDFVCPKCGVDKSLFKKI